MNAFVRLHQQLTLSTLLQIHVTLLVATFVFLGFSQLALASSEADPRRNLRGYLSRLDARRVLLEAAIVGALAMVGSVTTLLLCLVDGLIASLVSASLVLIELAGLSALLWHTFHALRET